MITKREKIEFKWTNSEDDFYLCFVLGYDLMKKDFEQCENKCCDDVFDVCKIIVKAFYVSDEIQNLSMSTYDALEEFLINHQTDIDELLNKKLSI